MGMLSRLSSFFSHWSFSHRSLASLSLLVMTALPACSQWLPRTTPETALRPTVTHLARGKNTFTLILENSHPSRSVLVLTRTLQIVDDTGATYKPAPFAMPPEEEGSKIILPTKKVQIRYILERSIADPTKTLSFVLNDLSARESTGPDWFRLPALQWDMALSGGTIDGGLEADLTAATSAKSEEGLDSLLVARVENLRRGCRGFDLVFENKTRDRTFSVAVKSGLTIVDETGHPYDLDPSNMRDQELQRNILSQKLLRIECVLQYPIEVKARVVTFSLNRITGELDGGTSYFSQPLEWDVRPRDCTRQEIAQEKELYSPPILEIFKARRKEFDKKEKKYKERQRKADQEVEKKLNQTDKEWEAKVKREWEQPE